MRLAHTPEPDTIAPLPVRRQRRAKGLDTLAGGTPVRMYRQHHFFNIRATITNISEEDIIDCFYNGITDPSIYRDFGRNRPKTIVGLRDMMHDWSK
jgi:hypothetical protein